MNHPYLQNTLHGLLRCECTGNCILKSMHVDKNEKGYVEITVEPYDDAFNINDFDSTLEKIERVLWRRRKAITKTLNADVLSISICNEYRMQAAFHFSVKSNRLVRVS